MLRNPYSVDPDGWLDKVNWEGSLVVFAFLGIRDPLESSVKKLFNVNYTSLPMIIVYALFLYALSQYLTSKFNREYILYSAIQNMVEIAGYKDRSAFSRIFKCSWMFLIAILSYSTILVTYITEAEFNSVLPFSVLAFFSIILLLGLIPLYSSIKKYIKYTVKNGK